MDMFLHIQFSHIDGNVCICSPAYLEFASAGIRSPFSQEAVFFLLSLSLSLSHRLSSK